jgi:dTDP-4-amino-4,6-dideoxygalactose transaminase
MRKVLRARPYIPEEDIPSILNLIEQSLRSGQLTRGPFVREFEERFATTVGVRHAVAVSSGTAALVIILRSIGIEGKEVIVPTETCVACGSAVVLAGGRPVFAEIKPDTLCLDIADVERRINKRTAAIMMVYMAGLIPPDLDDFFNLCHRHGIVLIEDAAHAHGSTFKQKHAGSLGIAGCFSFYPTKLITAAEGGMITTNDDSLAEMARSLRDHGVNPKGSDYIHISANWRMPEPCAAIGLVQLRHLGEFIEHRNQIAAFYNQCLSAIPGITPLPVFPDIRHSYWHYYAILDEGIDRSALAQILDQQFGVQTAWAYNPPCHLQPVFRDHFGYKPGDLPQSERILSRHIGLPMHAGLSMDDARWVIESLEAAIRLLSKR